MMDAADSAFEIVKRVVSNAMMGYAAFVPRAGICG